MMNEAINLRRGGTPYKDIANAIDAETSEGNITKDQAEAIKRATISSGLDDAMKALKNNK